MMPEPTPSHRVSVRLAVRSDELSPDRLDHATVELHWELRKRGLDASEDRGPARAGARSGEAIIAAALLVETFRSPDALRSLVEIAKAWLVQSFARSVELTVGDDTLIVTGVSSEEQRRLIDVWISRVEQ
jgi:hypothetical protein